MPACNPGLNIWNKAKKASKIREEKKDSIFAFA